MESPIISNRRLQTDYCEIVFRAPEIAARAEAGQFVHVRIDDRQDHILRRPFSIHDADPAAGTISVVYKIVGFGTKALSQLTAGQTCDLLGPLGRGFSAPGCGAIPVAVAGGYVSAALFLLRKKAQLPGVLLIGARTGDDIILVDRYRASGFDVRIATDDGSLGQKGRVTDLLPQLLADYSGKSLRFYGCGPHPMLIALGRQLRDRQLDGELSVDHKMCCGVGACFACVVKVNAPDAPEQWRYARSCAEGPVFALDQVYLGD